MSGSFHILYVDGLSRNRADLVRRLTDDDFSVTPAEDGSEALQRLNPSTDLVLLNASLAGLDGPETCSRLKRRSARPYLPIVLFSALRSDVLKLECFSAGADDFLEAPFEYGDLLSRVRYFQKLNEFMFTGAAPAFAAGMHDFDLSVDDLFRSLFAAPRATEPFYVRVGNGTANGVLGFSENKVVYAANDRDQGDRAVKSLLTLHGATCRAISGFEAAPNVALPLDRVFDFWLKNVSAWELFFRVLPPRNDRLAARLLHPVSPRDGDLLRRYASGAALDEVLGTGHTHLELARRTASLYLRGLLELESAEQADPPPGAIEPPEGNPIQAAHQQIIGELKTEVLVLNATVDKLHQENLDLQAAMTLMKVKSAPSQGTADQRPATPLIALGTLEAAAEPSGPRAEAEELRQRITETERSHRSVKAEAERLRKVIADLVRDKSSLTASLEAAREEKAKSAAQLAARDAAVEQQRQSTAVAETSAKALRESLAGLQKSLTASNREIDNRQRELEAARVLLEQSHGERDVLVEKLRALEKSVGDASAREAALQGQIVTLQRDAERLQGRIREQRTAIDSAAAAKGALEAELSRANTALQKATERERSLRADAERSSAVQADLRQSVQRLQKEIADLHAERDTAAEARKTLYDELKSTRVSLEVSAGEIAELQRALDDAREQVSDAKERQKSQATEIERLSALLTAAASEAASWQAKHGEQQARVSAGERSLAELAAQSAEWKKRFDDTDGRLREGIEKVRQLTESLAHARSFRARFPLPAGALLAGLVLGGGVTVGIVDRPSPAPDIAMVAATAAVKPAPDMAHQPAPDTAAQPVATLTKVDPAPETPAVAVEPVQPPPPQHVEPPEPMAAQVHVQPAKEPPAPAAQKPKAAPSSAQKPAVAPAPKRQPTAVRESGPARGENENTRRAAALYKEGRQKYAAADFASAIRLLEQAVSLEPKSAYLAELGRAYYDSGETSKARSALERALQKDPRHAEANLGLGVLLVDQGEIPAAKKAFSRFLKVAPRHASAEQVRMMMQQLP